MTEADMAELEALRTKVKNQAWQLQLKDETLHQKNLLLDALHMVWCDGACYTGVHRYEDRPVTEELVKLAERNTERLRRWFNSVQWRLTSGEYPTTSEYHRRYLERIAPKVEMAVSPAIDQPESATGPDAEGG